MKLTDDIIVTALNDGKTIRRKSLIDSSGNGWYGWRKAYKYSDELMAVWEDMTARNFAVTIKDILADDWEVVENDY